MRFRLRYALPIAQMILATVLLWWNYVWGQSILHRTHGSFGPLPIFTVLIGINAPVALARATWSDLVPWLWDNVLLVLGVGILWYWVALNIECWRKDHSVWMFCWIPLRLLANVLVVGVGGLLAFVIFDEFERHTRHFSASEVPLFLASYGLFFIAWAGILIVFFARDFIICLRSGRTLPEPTRD